MRHLRSFWPTSVPRANEISYSKEANSRFRSMSQSGMQSNWIGSSGGRPHFAGTSFLDLSELGSLRYGSDLMNITADATLPGALGTFGYDDEGTPAQRVDIVKEGTWVGVLSGRDSAAQAGLAPGGMVRADGPNRLPMVRMTNVGLVARSPYVGGDDRRHGQRRIDGDQPILVDR